MTEHGAFTMGAPLGITTDASLDLRLKCAGFEAPCNSVNPDFTLLQEHILESLGIWTEGDPDPDPDWHPVQAMSLGIDIFHVSEELLDLGAGEKTYAHLSADGGWSALLFTVDPDSDPTEAEDPTVSGLGVEAHSSVFDYVVPGSVAAGPPGVHLGLTSEQIQIQAGEKIHGLNLHMALYETTLHGPGSSFFTGMLPAPATVSVYFTFRRQFLDSVDSSAWDDPAAPSAIFRCVWDDGRWSAPIHFLDLPDPPPGHGGTPGDEIITGLSLRIENDTAHVLFSTRDASIDDQLEYLVATKEPQPSTGFAPGGPRRRVVVNEDNTFRSAGRSINVGRGLGDHCSQDPGLNMLTDSKPTILDDFVVARRIAGSEADLMVSGFRNGGAVLPVLRTCMNLPGWNGPTVTAEARFFHYEGFGRNERDVDLAPPTDLRLLGTKQVEYSGNPVFADWPLPITTADPWVDAIVAIWHFEAGGVWHFSPLCTLRHGGRPMRWWEGLLYWVTRIWRWLTVPVRVMSGLWEPKVQAVDGGSAGAAAARFRPTAR